MIRNAGLSTAMNLYRAGLQFALNVALATFLTPSDFGLVALILPVTLFILLIGDFGLTSAIIRSPTLSSSAAGAAWTLCVAFGAGLLAISVALYALGAFAAFPPPLAGLTVTFAVVVLLTLEAIVPRAVIERRLAYGRISLVETGSATLGFVAAVIVAKAGAGVWSFACYHFAMQGTRAVAYTAMAGDTTRPTGDWRAAMPLIGFGGWVVAFNLVNFVMRNGDRYFLGALLGTGALGIYVLGFQIMLVPLMAITWPVSGVLLSTLSRLGEAPSLQRSAFIAVLGLAATLTWPAMVFVAFRGDLLFGLMLPDRWDALGPVISRMALAGGLQSITAFIGPIFIVQGRLRQQFALGAVATSATLGVIALTAWQTGSLIAVADAYLVLTGVMAIVYFALIAWMLSLPARAILATLMPAVLLSVVAVAAVLAVEALVPIHGSVLHAVVATATYALVALGLLAAQHRRLRESLRAMQGAGIQAQATIA